MNRRFAAALACVLVSGPALADQFVTPLGGPSAGVVVERRVGTSGSVNVPVDESNPLPVTVAGTTPGSRTIVPLDVATVTTGGTAVTALAAGHRSAGGWLYNPATATVNLCINEVAAASGTTTASSLICIPPDRTYNLTPSANAVSVVSSDSAHPFGGMGYQ